MSDVKHDYHCPKCGNHFQRVVSPGDRATCPSCATVVPFGDEIGTGPGTFRGPTILLDICRGPILVVELDGVGPDLVIPCDELAAPPGGADGQEYVQGEDDGGDYGRPDALALWWESVILHEDTTSGVLSVTYYENAWYGRYLGVRLAPHHDTEPTPYAWAETEAALRQALGAERYVDAA